MSPSVIIRPEVPGDFSAVYEVNRRAFGRPNEADLVEVLRRAARPQVSLVAVKGDRVVGHVFFSPVTIGAAPAATGRGLAAAAEMALTPPAGMGLAAPAGMGLGPLAVDPDYQRQGIGGELVRAGLHACRKAGQTIVVVLGHPAYYRRFGFLTAADKGLTCEYDVPPEAFMVAELFPEALAGLSGVVKYLPAFAKA